MGSLIPNIQSCKTPCNLPVATRNTRVYPSNDKLENYFVFISTMKWQEVSLSVLSCFLCQQVSTPLSIWTNKHALFNKQGNISYKQKSKHFRVIEKSYICHVCSLYGLCGTCLLYFTSSAPLSRGVLSPRSSPRLDHDTFFAMLAMSTLKITYTSNPLTVKLLRTLPHD